MTWHNCLTHWLLEHVAVILKVWFSNSFYRKVVQAFVVNLIWSECHRPSLIRIGIGSGNGSMPLGTSHSLRLCLPRSLHKFVLKHNIRNIELLRMISMHCCLLENAHRHDVAFIHQWTGSSLIQVIPGQTPGPWFNIKMSSYQYRKSHCGDKTIVRSSYLHKGISYTGNNIRCHLYIESGPCLTLSHNLSQWWLVVNWALRNKTETSQRMKSNIKLKKMHLKMLSAKCQPLCSGLTQSLKMMWLGCRAGLTYLKILTLSTVNIIRSSEQRIWIWDKNFAQIHLPVGQFFLP